MLVIVSSVFDNVQSHAVAHVPYNHALYGTPSATKLLLFSPQSIFASQKSNRKSIRKSIASSIQKSIIVTIIDSNTILGSTIEFISFVALGVPYTLSLPPFVRREMNIGFVEVTGPGEQCRGGWTRVIVHVTFLRFFSRLL